MTREELFFKYACECKDTSCLPATKKKCSAEFMRDLDSVIESEEKTAEWIDGTCSNCHCDVPAYIIDWKWQKDMDAKYCPQCGSKMIGVQQNDIK